MANSTLSFYQILLRGIKSRCPACGQGKIFRSFLKVADKCDACNEELMHHQADDFPAYIVIVIVGHIIVPLTIFFIKNDHFPYWLPYAILLPLSATLAGFLIEPVKGAVVATQWHFGMHNFAKSKKRNKSISHRE